VRKHGAELTYTPMIVASKFLQLKTLEERLAVIEPHPAEYGARVHRHFRPPCVRPAVMLTPGPRVVAPPPCCRHGGRAAASEAQAQVQAFRVIVIMEQPAPHCTIRGR